MDIDMLRRCMVESSGRPSHHAHILHSVRAACKQPYRMTEGIVTQSVWATGVWL